MSVRQVTICDQCGAEVDAGSPASEDWHNVSIHDHKSGITRPMDLCGGCWRHVQLADLLHKELTRR